MKNFQFLSQAVSSIINLNLIIPTTLLIVVRCKRKRKKEVTTMKCLINGPVKKNKFTIITNITIMTKQVVFTMHMETIMNLDASVLAVKITSSSPTKKFTATKKVAEALLRDETKEQLDSGERKSSSGNKIEIKLAFKTVQFFLHIK